MWRGPCQQLGAGDISGDRDTSGDCVQPTRTCGPKRLLGNLGRLKEGLTWVANVGCEGTGRSQASCVLGNFLFLLFVVHFLVLPLLLKTSNFTEEHTVDIMTPYYLGSPRANSFQSRVEVTASIMVNVYPALHYFVTNCRHQRIHL
jgi:hypothetical protein